MGFKTVTSYNEERFGGFFLLRNDGDYADVVFLYQGEQDVLVADVHYIKSPDYSGYVHCCGKGCPACAKGIRTQTKLFIPMYNLKEQQIQFFDRTMRFEPQLQKDVFESYPNPSEYVFRIVRHGAAGSVDTTYEIKAIARNTVKPYAQILSENNAVMPDYYSNVCKELSVVEMESMLNSGEHPSSGYVPNNDYTYGATPRVPATTPDTPLPETPTVPTMGDYVPPEIGQPDAFTTGVPEMPQPDIPASSGNDGEPVDEEELGEPEF